MTPYQLAIALLFATAGATAAPIYRCGPDGRIYSQTPCPGGSVVESTDPRTAAQRAEARRVQAAERKAAQAMERDRRDFESKGERAPAIASLGPAEAASAPPREHKRGGKSKRKRPSGDDKDFTAVVPGGKAVTKP